MDGRYGDLRLGAAEIAGQFQADASFAGLSVDEVHQLLKDVEPVFYNSEVAYARRLAMAEKYRRQRKPNAKAGQKSNDLAQDLWSHLLFEGSGTATPPLLPELKDDERWRPMSREPLRKIKPLLVKFADDHGFPEGRRSTRFSEDDLWNPEGLTHMKRLCLLVSQFFWPLFQPMHWMKD